MKTTAATTAKPEKTVKQPSALARMYHSAISMLSSVRSAEGDTSGTSDSELRLALYEALRHTEPAFDNYYYGDGIFDVWQDTNTVVYCTCPDDEMLLWQQTYTMNADGSVTLNGDRQRVEYKPVPVAEVESLSGTKSAGGARHSSNDVKMIKTIHDTSVDLGAECESVAAASTALAVSATKSDCNCTSAARNAASRKDTTVDKDKFKPIVERLIRGAATEEDRVVLTTEFGFDAEMLKTAGATSKPDKSAVKPAPTRLVAASSHTPTDDDDADADDGEELTEEQWLASAPASLRAMHAKYQAEDTARRTSLLSTLAVAAKGIYTEAQLVSKPTDELEALAKLAKKDAKPVAASTPRNFAAQGVAVPPDASTSDEQFKRLNPPNGYEIALARAAGKEVKDIYTYGRENSSSTAKAPN